MRTTWQYRNAWDACFWRTSITRGSVGENTRALAYETIDYYDTTAQITSMMRTTSFQTSIIAQIAEKLTILAHGVQPPESAMLDVPLELLLEELKKHYDL